MEADTSITLETMVPMGERAVPFFRLHDGRNPFEATVSDHVAVDDIHVVSTHNDETLYALDWAIGSETFFEGIVKMGAHVMEATGTADTWGFELRFPFHETLSDFQAYCAEVLLPITVKRIYNPTKPDAGPWFGLTVAQREMLTQAVKRSYYAIPRQTSTQALADQFGISDQAVTERLRRGIGTLVTNTLLLTEEHDSSIPLHSDGQ
ncbi:MAG: helix-turn-helix domain-containing protein [Halobacteriales archaeon]